MDETTLRDHRDRCVPEPTQTRNADVSMLTEAERDRTSAQAVEELAKQAQELQLGYE